MQLLDQILSPDGTEYTVRVWRDEVAPDAIDVYKWVGTLPDSISRAQYEAQQVAAAKALSALQVPEQEPTIITQDSEAIASQAAAVQSNTGQED